MQILVDIGNTRTKYCTVEAGQLGELHYCENTELTFDWFSSHWFEATQIITASVASADITQKISTWCKAKHIVFTEVKSALHAFGVTSGYQNPQQLGVDRWLTLLAAKRLYPSTACLIIDAGTATTVDYIDQHGQHHGGWILAGIETLVESIQKSTANVVGQDWQINQQMFGKNTAENLSQAAWAASIGLIAQAKQVVADSDLHVEKVIITGGNGTELARLLNQAVDVNPKLVFHGLAAYLS